MSPEDKIDWTAARLGRGEPDAEGGDPALCGTCVPTDAPMQKFNNGATVAEISKHFKIPQDHIRAILIYASGPLP